MKNDRLLTGILVGILVLILLSLVLYFQRQSSTAYNEEDTPQAFIQNYSLALAQGDYEKAYGYLADSANKPTYTNFRQAFLTNQLDVSNASLRAGIPQIEGKEAVVPITLLQARDGLFGSVNRSDASAPLVNEADRWKILELPYPFMLWEWLPSSAVTAPKPIRPPVEE